MGLITRTWIDAARARRRFQRRVRPALAREELIQRHAPGRSFADVGAMWGIHAKLSFLAEECGATSVTAVDIMPSTETFEAERAKRQSKVRFVHGDLHDSAVLDEVGIHDVVFCAGVLYHAPNPIHTLECLRRITGETLILQTAAIPEVPGIDQACVFYPGLSESARAAYVPTSGGTRLGITHPFERLESEADRVGDGQSQSYGNWWWGITPSALRGMLTASGFEVLELGREPFYARVIARPVDS